MRDRIKHRHIYRLQALYHSDEFSKENIPIVECSISEFHTVCAIFEFPATHDVDDSDAELYRSVIHERICLWLVAADIYSNPIAYRFRVEDSWIYCGKNGAKVIAYSD